MNQPADILRRIPTVHDRAAVLIPVCVALVLRLIYVLSLRDSPAFAFPILDEAIHDSWARGGMGFMHDGVPWFRAPLYVWFLKLNYAVNDGYLYVRIVQAILSALTVGIVADLGRRVAGPLAGLVGGLLLAFCWPVIYFAGELVSVSLFMLLVMGGLWCLVRAGSARSVGFALTGAIVLGIASMAQPKVLAFLPALFWLGLRSWRGWLTTPRARIGTVVAMLGLMLLPGLAMTARNLVVGGEAVFIASESGLNFYIGNNPESDGRTTAVPGTAATGARRYEQAIRMAEDAEGRPLSRGEVGEHYRQRGLEYWTSDPADALSLYGTKLRLLLGAAERGDDKNLHFWRDRNTMLRLPVFSSWALILALGMVGIFLTRRRAEATPLNLFAGLYVIGLMFFLINEGSRTPATIMLAGFAGVPFAVAAERWREDRTRVLMIGLTALAVLTLSQLDRIGFDGHRVEADVSSQYTLGDLYLRAGDADRAAESYVLALDAVRRFPVDESGELERMTRDRLVEALLRSGREEDAEQQVEFFQRTWPEDYRAELLQGRLMAFRYRHRVAKRSFDAALERNPESAEAWLGVGRAQIEMANYRAAEKSLREAARLSGPRADVTGARALLALAGENSVLRARRFAERALRLDPGEPASHWVLGDLYLRRDLPGGMMYHYRLALMRDPHNIPINRFLTRGRMSVEDLLAEDDMPVPPPLD